MALASVYKITSPNGMTLLMVGDSRESVLEFCHKNEVPVKTCKYMGRTVNLTLSDDEDDQTVDVSKLLERSFAH